MVDIFLEYGYYIVGIGTAVFASVVSFFSVRKYLKEAREENQRLIDDKITAGVEKVILHIDNSDQRIQEKFVTTDNKLTQTQDDLDDIEKDVKVLEEDFKSLCEKIGKHDYIVDKVLPEYINLRDSIYKFKGKIDEHIFVNKDTIERNTEDDKNQK